MWKKKPISSFCIETNSSEDWMNWIVDRYRQVGTYMLQFQGTYKQKQRPPSTCKRAFNGPWRRASNYVILQHLKCCYSLKRQDVVATDTDVHTHTTSTNIRSTKRIYILVYSSRYYYIHSYKETLQMDVN